MIDNDKFKEINVMYVSIEHLTNLYNEDKEINYKNLGVILNLKVELYIFMFKEFISKKGRGKSLVNLNSFDLKRKLIVDHLIEYIIINKQLGKSIGSVGQYIQTIKNFIVWANSYSLDFMLSIEDAKNIYIQYITFFKMSIRNGTLNGNHCYYSQISIGNFLKQIYNDSKSYITAGAPKIQKTKLKNDIEVSDEDDKAYAFNFYTKLFDQIYDFLINNKLYPLKLELPNDNSFWILPSSVEFNSKMANNNQFFSEKDGRYLELNEVQKQKNYLRDYNLQKNNLLNSSNPFSLERIYLATKAINAYYIHFLTVTGMNDSVAGRLLWNKEYELEKSQQKFSNIKYRADNKPVEFPLQNKFIPRFRNFLKLRDYALKGKDSEYLFFSIKNNKIIIPKNQILGKLSSQINKLMRKSLDENLPIINSKQLRINKTNYIVKEDGPIAASQVMQNSLIVVKNNYLTENIDETSMQFTRYFDKLNKNIFANKNENLVETSVGQCRSIYNPVSELKNNIFKSECKLAEGCLFCEKYACHADEVDLKKLYSLLFVIQEASINAKNLEHFDRVYGDVIIRANSIINEIIKKYNLLEVASKVKKEVFEYEDLYPYWERKLKTLCEMGVI